MPLSTVSLDAPLLSRPSGAPVALAPSYEALLALLDGAPGAEHGLPSVPSGSPAVLLSDAGTTALVAVPTGDGYRAIGWVPSAWLRPQRTAGAAA